LPGWAVAGTLTCQLVRTVWPGATVANVDGEVAWMVQSLGPLSDRVTLRSGCAPAGLGNDVVAVNVAPGCTCVGALSENGW